MFSNLEQLHHGACKRFRLFLGKIVTRARDDMMGTTAGELRCRRSAVGRRNNAIRFAVQRDHWDRDGRQRRQSALKVGVLLIAVGQTEAVPIAVDHDVDVIGIVVGRCRLSKLSSSKCQFGDHCRHNILAIPRRLAARPARPRSSWK